MPVVTQQVLFVRFDAVTASASRVQLITDPGSTVNVRLQNRNEDGQVNGSITGELSLNMIAQEVTLNPGDLLLTSGLGGNYPTDVLVGQVVTIERTENELFQTALVQPVVDYEALRAVLVITNFRTINIDPLIPGAN